MHCSDEEWDIAKRVLEPGNQSDAYATTDASEDDSSSEENDEQIATKREFYYQPQRAVVEALIFDSDTPEKFDCSSLETLRLITLLLGSGWHIGTRRE